MIRGIIFDIDGTLIDSVDAHSAAWHEAFAAFGMDVSQAHIRAQIGKGGDELMPVFLTPAFIGKNGKALEHTRADIFHARYLPRVKAFPQTRELFERLAADGIRVALASSAKGEELTHYERLAQIEDLVAAETSSDDAERSKPHPDIFEAALDRLSDIPKEDIRVVGDSPFDAEAACKAGLAAMGVLCGGFAETDLRQAGCRNIFADPADLLSRYAELTDSSR